MLGSPFNALDTSFYHHVVSKYITSKNDNINGILFLSKMKAGKCIVTLFLILCSEFLDWKLVQR